MYPNVLLSHPFSFGEIDLCNLYHQSVHQTFSISTKFLNLYIWKMIHLGNICEFKLQNLHFVKNDFAKLYTLT